jgi:hypothetical protein
VTTDEYRKALKALGLSQEGAARFLHFDERRARRWASGQARVPWIVSALLRVMLRYRISIEAVAVLQKSETEKE